MASTGSVSMKRMATAGECTTVYLVGPSTHDDVQAFAEQASCRKQFVHCVPRPVQKVVDRCIHSRSAHILMVALPAPIGCTQAARVGHDTEVNATRVRQLSKEPWTFADVVSECPGSCGFDPPNCGRTDSPQSPGNPRSRKPQRNGSWKLRGYVPPIVQTSSGQLEETATASRKGGAGEPGRMGAGIHPGRPQSLGSKGDQTCWLRILEVKPSAHDAVTPWTERLLSGRLTCSSKCCFDSLNPPLAGVGVSPPRTRTLMPLVVGCSTGRLAW